MALQAFIDYLQSHSTLVSLIALAIAVASFVYSMVKGRQHTRQWNALNLPKLIIRDLKFATWAEKTKKDFELTDWGYDDGFAIVDSPQPGLSNPDKVHIPTRIIAIQETGAIYEGSWALTPLQMEEELRKRGENPHHFRPHKSYRVLYYLINVGATKAHNLTVSTELFSDPNEVVLQGSSISRFTLESQDGTWGYVHFHMPIDEPFPRPLRLVFKISYTDTNEAHHAFEYPFVYDKQDAAFRRA